MAASPRTVQSRAASPKIMAFETRQPASQSGISRAGTRLFWLKPCLVMINAEWRPHAALSVCSGEKDTARSPRESDGSIHDSRLEHGQMRKVKTILNKKATRSVISVRRGIGFGTMVFLYEHKVVRRSEKGFKEGEDEVILAVGCCTPRPSVRDRLACMSEPWVDWLAAGLAPPLGPACSMHSVRSNPIPLCSCTQAVAVISQVAKPVNAAVLLSRFHLAKPQKHILLYLFSASNNKAPNSTIDNPSASALFCPITGTLSSLQSNINTVSTGPIKQFAAFGALQYHLYAMSFSPLPAPGSAASSSIWTRRMITKSVPTTDAEVELNVLSLLLDVPLTSLDEQDLATSPISLHNPLSPWSSAVSPALHSASSFDAATADLQFLRSASPAPNMPAPIQRSKSMDSSHFDNGYSLEMHAAQTAVKAALDVLEEPSLNRGLRISTSLSQSPASGNSLGLRGCLTAPLSPALSSPTSPAESCFSGTESDGTKKKGRARMSQEKRKRLARRREREALVAALTQQPGDGGVPTAEMQNYIYHNSHLSSAPSASHLSHSAPVTPIGSYFASSASSTFGGGFPFSSSPTEVSSAAAAFNVPISSPRSTIFGFSSAGAADLPSPALTHASVATSSSAFGSIGTPNSSPMSALSAIGSDASSSPPTLVVQPPSPQRLRGASFAPRTTAKPSAGNGAYHQQWNGFVSASNLASVY